MGNELNIEELKEHAPLLWYIKNFYPSVQIKTEQANVSNAICPFHDDKESPSLAIYANGSWKCFGCGMHGDVIQFVQNMENVDFIDACKIIGNNVGFPIELQQVNPAWKAYMEQMDSHVKRYWNNLQSNAEAMNYLMNVRKMTPEIINEFRLGLTYVDEYKYRSDMGNISNRIVIPLLEHSIHKPHSIGAAYRTFHDEIPKYVNDINKDGRKGQDPNLNGVFIKGNILYGYPQAKQAIKQAGYGIIVEGYFDVISMHQANIKNTIGIMGTHMSDNQLQSLSKITNSVLIFLDGDEPGINGMVKLAQQLYKENFEVMMIIAPKCMDPDELCKDKNYNPIEIMKIIKDNMYDAMDYIIKINTESFKSHVTTEQRKIIKTMEPILNSIPSSFKRDFYTRKLFKEIGLNN
jgi:DNA primase